MAKKNEKTIISKGGLVLPNAGELIKVQDLNKNFELLRQGIHANQNSISEEGANAPTAIPLETISIETYPLSKTGKVVLISRDAVLAMISVFKDSTFEITYGAHWPSATLPTSQDLTDLYFTGAGIHAIEIATGNPVILKDGTPMHLKDLEGFILETDKGLLEIAGKVGQKIMIDTSKNNLTKEIADILKRLGMVDTEISKIQSNQAGVFNDIVALTQHTQTNFNDIKSLKYDVTDHTTQIQALESQQNTNTQDLATLKPDMVTAKRAIITLGNDKVDKTAFTASQATQNTTIANHTHDINDLNAKAQGSIDRDLLLQDDMDNLINSLAVQTVDFATPLKLEYGLPGHLHELTIKLSDLPQWTGSDWSKFKMKEKVGLKLVHDDGGGTHTSEFIFESWNDGSMTNNKLGKDGIVEMIAGVDNFIIRDANRQVRDGWAIASISTIKGGATINIKGKADVNLGNIDATGKTAIKNLAEKVVKESTFSTLKTSNKKVIEAINEIDDILTGHGGVPSGNPWLNKTVDNITPAGETVIKNIVKPTITNEIKKVKAMAADGSHVDITHMNGSSDDVTLLSEGWSKKQLAKKTSKTYVDTELNKKMNLDGYNAKYNTAGKDKLKKALFSYNADKLVANDTTSTGNAYIGSGYKGKQYYGASATNVIQIGSTKNDAHKADNKLIQGSKSATFEKIIKKANETSVWIDSQWVDITPKYGTYSFDESHIGRKLKVKIDKDGIIFSGLISYNKAQSNTYGMVSFSINPSDLSPTFTNFVFLKILEKSKTVYYQEITKQGHIIPVEEKLAKEIYIWYDGFITNNTFKGSFSSDSKRLDFLKCKNIVKKQEFGVSTHLTGISMPTVTDIGYYAFGASMHLTDVYAPLATTIGDMAFLHIVNGSTTKVTIPSKFNNKVDKDRIFHNWDKITFHWV